MLKDEKERKNGISGLWQDFIGCSCKIYKGDISTLLGVVGSFCAKNAKIGFNS
jgi:hypothetical protein